MLILVAFIEQKKMTMKNAYWPLHCFGAIVIVIVSFLLDKTTRPKIGKRMFIPNVEIGFSSVDGVT